MLSKQRFLFSSIQSVERAIPESNNLLRRLRKFPLNPECNVSDSTVLCYLARWDTKLIYTYLKKSSNHFSVISS